MIRYSGGVINWTMGELREMDRRTRKIMNLSGRLLSRSSFARLYQKRKEEGRGLISVLECVISETKGLNDYSSQSNEEMLKAVVTIKNGE